LKLLDEHSGEKTKRVFEVGCGNGSVAQQLSQRGYDVTGVDPSIEGINQAHAAYPHLKLQRGSAYDNLAARYGTFPFVLSLEVVEHLYSPRDYAKNMYALLEPGGLAIISTPYHGYIKNLIMALTGTLDRHFTSLWDHGHIKFWSKKTLSILLREAGFTHIEFLRVGRIPVLAKSMIAVAKASR
jgi:2-polyprenyl-6-hydroxyphenyl methylase/3-demethylubiquinone-9 3-methyltransferase